MPWYVVSESDQSDDDEKVWTVSQYPDQSGWNSDSGYPGYGMPRVAAQFLVDAANEKEARDGLAFPVMVGEW